MTKQYFTKDEVIALAHKCGYGKTITSKKLREFDLESRANELHALCEMAAQVAIGKPAAADKAGGDEPFLFIYFDPTAGTHGSHRVAETHPPPADAFPVYTRPQPQGENE